mgnify:CR=1 FL=1
MKKILFTSLAVLGLGITGCSNEDLGVAKSGVDEVCATMGDAESRTAMTVSYTHLTLPTTPYV